MENNIENKVNESEQKAQVENNEKKSWFGTAISAIKNTAGTVVNCVMEHKTASIGIGAAIVAGTLVAVVLKKGKVEAPAVDADGFDNK